MREAGGMRWTRPGSRPDSTACFMIEFRHVCCFVEDSFHLELFHSIIMRINPRSLPEVACKLKNTSNALVVIVIRSATRAIFGQAIFGNDVPVGTEGRGCGQGG